MGGYENELVAVPAGGVRLLIAEFEDLQKQLAEREKQIVMLRDAIFLTCCNPEGEVCINGTTKQERDALQAALYATQDLSGLVPCDAEPVSIWEDGDRFEQLYKARNP
jgi:hypothetical protein